LQASYRPKIQPPAKEELPDLERRNALVLEHLDWARTIARAVAGRLPSWVAADDLIGPAEIALVQAAERYDPVRNDSFRGYAERRIRGACYDSVRRRNYPVATPAVAEQADPHPDPEEQMRATEMLRVWQVVDRLPPRHRLLIRCLYIDGVSLAEQSAHCTVGCARLSQIHREALVMLRGLL